MAEQTPLAPASPNPLMATLRAIGETLAHAAQNKGAYTAVIALVIAAWPMIFPGTPPPDPAKLQQVADETQAAIVKAKEAYEHAKAAKAEMEAASPPPHKRTPPRFKQSRTRRR